jgi:hypothetical protein
VKSTKVLCPDNMTLKGQSLWKWKKWLEEELKPPLSPDVTSIPQVKHVLEAFLELVDQVSCG